MDEEREREMDVDGEERYELDESDAIGLVPSGAAEAEAGAGDEQVRLLNAQCEEINEKYMRLYAEFDNYRKMAFREKQDLLKYGSEPLVYELLTVVDTLEMGLRHAGDDPGDGVRQGIEMTLKEFLRVLEKFGVRRIEAAGRPFDPKIHEAMSQVVDDGVDEGTVIEEFRTGYTFHDKVLRAPLVSVSKKSTSNGNEHS